MLVKIGYPEFGAQGYLSRPTVERFRKTPSPL